jgi:hypothetical protein
MPSWIEHYLTIILTFFNTYILTNYAQELTPTYLNYNVTQTGKKILSVNANI